MQEAMRRSSYSNLTVPGDTTGKMVVAMLVVAAVCFTVGLSVGQSDKAVPGPSAAAAAHEPVYGRYGHFTR